MAWLRIAGVITGEVVEWLMAPVLKTGEGKPSVGSNPTLSVHSDPSPRLASRLVGELSFEAPPQPRQATDLGKYAPRRPRLGKSPGKLLAYP